MKILKTFAVLVLGAFAMSASAANTAAATIQFASSNRQATIFLYENASESQLSDYIPPIAGDYVITAYAYVGTNKYQTYKQASLNNLKIYFKANKKQTSYTLSFSDVLGNIVLKRSDVDTTIIAGNSTTYEFTCNTEDEIEFTVNPAVEYNYTRDIATGKWGTICFPEAISEVVGATIYEFVGKTETSVMADPVSLPLEKGKAYLFLASADAQGFNYSSASVATAPVANNGLVGTFEDMTSTDEAPYVIKGNSLVPASKANVPANRAYVPNINAIVSSEAPARAGRMIFNIVGTATGVEELEAAPAMNGKVMMNGKLVIIRDGKMFNAQGAAL